MGCRVGMTTDLTSREAHWRRKYTTMKKWVVLFNDLDKEIAQEIENKIKEICGCDAGDGGDDPDDLNKKWSVYLFNF